MREDVIAPASMPSALTHGQTKKVLRSGKGCHAVSQTIYSGAVTRYRSGQLLDVVTVNYCTAVGLIQAGVLAKPTDPWVEARMTNPWKRPTEGSPSAIEKLQPTGHK